MFFVGATTAAPALAEGLTVDASRCASRIRIEADNAPLGDVLQRLSAAMGFRLVARTDLSERVSRSLAGAPEDVLKRLMQGRNLVVDSNPEARCSGREALTTVWILPAGDSVERAAVANPAPPAMQPADATLRRSALQPRPRGTRKRMSEEAWQQMKKDYKAGKVKADPETGLPIPVEQEPEAPAK